MSFVDKMKLANKRKRNMIKHPTYTESLLYNEIKKQQTRLPSHLRSSQKQRIILNGKSFYILDFYFAYKKVCIEIDGLSHKYTKDYDANRDSFLFFRKNIITLRIPDYLTTTKVLSLTDTILHFIEDVPITRWYESQELRMKKLEQFYFHIKELSYTERNGQSLAQEIMPATGMS